MHLERNSAKKILLKRIQGQLMQYFYIVISVSFDVEYVLRVQYAK